MGICKLCLKNKELRESHVIPDFTGKWIKNTSVTGKLRSSDSVNKRIQDLIKVKLLCDDCESIFQKYEKYFSENIFKPFLNSYTPKFKYDENLIKFIVSLSWRMLVVSMPKVKWKSDEHKAAAEKSEKVWRDFLYKNKDIGNYEHHLLLLRFVPDAPKVSGTTVDINWYFFRSVEGTIVQNIQETFTYVKIPGFVIISPLYEIQFCHSKNTKINFNGIIDLEKQGFDDSIFTYLVQRSDEALSPLKNLSPKQWEKIESSYKKNEENIFNSYFYHMEAAKEFWSDIANKNNSKGK